MEIVINGEIKQVPNGWTVAQLLDDLQLSAKPLAVEVNLEVVPRAKRGEVTLAAGDRLELVTLVGGG